MSHAKRLRELLAGQPFIAPGCYDALTALLVEQAGFSCAYVSGASIAFTRLGRPDIGLTTLTEVAGTVGNIRDRVALPLIVDGDNGFGNALNVQRTVRLLEKMGASAIQLEDQTSPKRCGHLEGKSLVSTGEMLGKLKAAQDARSNSDTVIVARTDALAVDGFEAGLERAHAYAEAGADVLFVEALRSVEQFARVGRELGGRDVVVLLDRRDPRVVGRFCAALGLRELFLRDLSRVAARTDPRVAPERIPAQADDDEQDREVERRLGLSLFDFHS